VVDTAAAVDTAVAVDTAAADTVEIMAAAAAVVDTTTVSR